MRGRAVVAATTAVLLAAPAEPAVAGGGQRAEFRLALGSPAPGTPTGVVLHVRLHGPGRPHGKPVPLRSAVFTGPPGWRVDTGALPRCRASDLELRLLGAAACPRETAAGRGTYTAVTGLGAPVDPFVGDAHVFNGDRELIEVVTVRGTTVSPGFDRLAVRGEALVANPPVTPGGPPDGETATKEVELVLPVRVTGGRALVTTPPSCPPSGWWRSTAVFGFADGRTETVTSRTACRAAVRPPAARAAGRGRRCLRTGRLVLRLPRRRTARARRLELRVDGRLVRRLPAAARRARVDLRGRRAGRHRIEVVAVTAAGRRRVVRRTVRTCPRPTDAGRRPR